MIPLEKLTERRGSQTSEGPFVGQPVTSDQLGGIDFNAKNLDVKVREEEGSLGSLSSLGSTDQNDPANSINFIVPDDLQGLVPVIINIVPVTNLYNLLGLSTEKNLEGQTKPTAQKSSSLPLEPAEIKS